MSEKLELSRGIAEKFRAEIRTPMCLSETTECALLNYCAGTLVGSSSVQSVEGVGRGGPCLSLHKIGEWKAAGPLLKEPAAAASSGAVYGWPPGGSGMLPDGVCVLLP